MFVFNISKKIAYFTCPFYALGILSHNENKVNNDEQVTRLFDLTLLMKFP